MEFRPLVDEDATEIERLLLRAGRSDGPRKEAGVRLLAALSGLPPASATVPRPGHGLESGLADTGLAGQVKLAALVKWAKIVLVALGVVGAAAVTYRLARPSAVVPSATPPVPEAVRVVAPPEARSPAEAPASPEAREVVAIPGQDEPRAVLGAGNAKGRRAGLSNRARESTRETDVTEIDHSLGMETTALDRAREVLDANQPIEALRLLDEYHRRFSQGRLQPEAMVLRLAALVRAGRYGAADSLANQLLANDAYKPYARRIRSLLREAKQ